MSQTTSRNKTILRKLMLNRIRALSKEEIQRQSEDLFKQVIELPRYKKAQKISLYLSTDYEIDTIKLLKHALEVDKKRCFVPYIPKKAPEIQQQEKPATRMLMLELESMRQYEEMPRNRWGIKEFSGLVGLAKISKMAAAPPDGLDMILVPGVAFTREGRRLGHGKGYYDEFLLDWMQRCAPVERNLLYTVGLCLNEQLLVDEHELPLESHDFRVDKVLVAP